MEVITPVVDECLMQTRQGEKKLIVVHSSKGAPKPVLFYLMNCKEFFVGYVIELCCIVKNEAILPPPDAVSYNPMAKRPAVKLSIECDT